MEISHQQQVKVKVHGRTFTKGVADFCSVIYIYQYDMHSEDKIIEMVYQTKIAKYQAFSSSIIDDVTSEQFNDKTLEKTVGLI